MRRIAISVAALTAMGVLATAAQADVIAGGPVKKGNLVFKLSPSQSVGDSRYGYWAEDPASAAAPKETARKRSAR